MKEIVLDANVLHSNTLRGLFLWMSKADNLCFPVWSIQIWEEVFRNHPGDDAENRKFRAAMEEIVLSRFPNSMRLLKEDYERIGLPDPNDEHIVALARQEEVATVVTFNLRDFPADRISLVGIGCVHPDEFLCGLYETRKDLMNDALFTHLQNLNRTRPTTATYIDGLRKADVPRFAACLGTARANGSLFDEFWA